MKILYAIQGTGNGHVSRAREIVPILSKYAEVDVVLSGTHTEVDLGYPIKYKFHGFGFKFGKRGGVAIGKTLQDIRLFRFIRDVINLPVKDYDLVISDVEPVTAWACKIKGVKCLEMSHQISLQSPHTPRLKGLHYGDLLLKVYTPCTHRLGFHFERYDDFIHTPVIRKEIRNLSPIDLGHYCVYLPAYDDDFIYQKLSKHTHIQWIVFSKHTQSTYTKANVTFEKISNQKFMKAFETCTGLLTGGGFEGPAEALFLGKKLLCVPMRNQFEQLCNAKAIEALGVPVIWKEKEFDTKLKHWIEQAERISVNFPDETESLLLEVLNSTKKSLR